MFNQSSLPEPYPDEALSSWMYRVREILPEPAIRALNDISYQDRETSPLVTPYLKVQRGLGADLDFRFERPEILAFTQAYDLSLDWIRSVFSPASAITIPISFRSDYCLQCMEESIAEVGFPVYLKSWRLLLKPFCQKHGCVLQSTNAYLHGSIDFGMDIFEYSCANPHELEREGKWLAKDSEIQNLSRMVVSRIDFLLNQAEDAVVQDKVQSFLMTLLRMTLMPKLWGNYSSIIKFTVQAGEDFESSKEMPMFYQLPLRVTGMVRARSFYLIGLLLGWIDEEQAGNARSMDDFYLATSASTLWRSVGNSARIRNILHLYSTELLGVSMLAGWEHF